MKKIILSVAAISSLMFASCTNDADQISEAQKEQNAIAFSSYSMLPKGAPIVDNEAFETDGASFEVVGFLNGNAAEYMRAQIKCNGGWIYANSLDKAYWPNGLDDKLTFYAVAPYLDFYPVNNDNVIAYAAESATITYTIPTETNQQQDLMYASTAAMSKPSDGNVTLPFKHALNQVHFMAKTESKNLFVDIAANGIELCNINSKGTFTFPGAGGYGSWTEQNALAEFVAINKKEITINTTSVSDKAIPVSDSNDILMLMPQLIVPWKPDNSVAATATGQKGAYLKINCKLYTVVGKEKVYYHQSVNGDYAPIYVPFAGIGMYDMGKKITYTLIFGGGFTDEGVPILTPITFNTSVIDWGDGCDDNINTQEPDTTPVAN